MGMCNPFPLPFIASSSSPSRPRPLKIIEQNRDQFIFSCTVQILIELSHPVSILHRVPGTSPATQPSHKRKRFHQINFPETALNTTQIHGMCLIISNGLRVKSVSELNSQSLRCDQQLRQISNSDIRSVSELYLFNKLKNGLNQQLFCCPNVAIIKGSFPEYPSRCASVSHSVLKALWGGSCVIQ